MGGANVRTNEPIRLQLDANNAKQTMEVSEVSRFEVLVVGEDTPRQNNNGNNDDDDEDDDDDDTADGNGEASFVEKLGLGKDAKCLICLEPFASLPSGTELRRLPCDHIYCRQCIDQWLIGSSAKCPELSCFWIVENDDDDDDDDDERVGFLS